MGLTTTSPPAVEPLSLVEIKEHLRITHNIEDNLIGGYITAARLATENFTRRRLITQTVRLTLDGFRGWVGPCILLPVAPIQSVSAVQYLDAAGDWQTVSATDYQLRLAEGEPLQLIPAYGKTWPVPRSGADSVRIDLVAGYGDAGSDVPGDILQAIRFMIAHYYTHRSAVVTGTITAELPLAFRTLLSARVLNI